ncbi:uncharacterized protein LOC107780418 [Nicotiana tabacum]|uniref:Uncharacterized protein LOC107780418 n=2 Tax=Nicotiana tabacum TaxID=4097 RepID=A0AC58UF10_TOBAC
MRFNMKPLKTGNEVGSPMKSTSKYTFIAPGAIGAIAKGRGRGLRSMCSSGMLEISRNHPSIRGVFMLVKVFQEFIATQDQILHCLLIKKCEGRLKSPRLLRKSICKLMFHFLHLLIKLYNPPKQSNQVP